MKEGLICAKALENDLAEKIAYLISRPEVSSKLAQAAYLRLKENYDINVVGKALVTFCNILKIDIS
jgi:glycosyltransferase involved in cell wall biosynthesis